MFIDWGVGQFTFKTALARLGVIDWSPQPEGTVASPPVNTQIIYNTPDDLGNYFEISLPTLPVISLIGDSNAVGLGTIINPMPEQVPQTVTGGEIWDNSSAFADITVTGTPNNQGGTSPDRMGCEVPLLYGMQKMLQKSVYMVKCGVGGSKMNVEWNPTSLGTSITTYHSRVNAVRAKMDTDGYRPNHIGTVVYLGTNDAFSSTNANAFAANIEPFLAKLDEFWGGNSGKLIFMYPKDNGSASDPANWVTIRAAIAAAAVANPRISYVEPSVYDFLDTVHYDSPTHTEVGRLASYTLAQDQFIPGNLTETYNWHDASDVTSITKDGSNNVSVWANKKALGTRDFVQAGATGIQPDYIAGTYPYLNFNNAEYMTCGAISDFTFMHTATGGTLISVVTPVGTGDAAYFYLSTVNATGPGFWVFHDNRSAVPATHKLNQRQFNNSTNSGTTGSSANNTLVPNTPCVISSSYFAGVTPDVRVRKDNVQVASVGGFSAGTGNAGAVLTLGARAGALDFKAIAKFHEILIFNSQVPSFLVNLSTRKLMSKWGIS